MLEIGRDVQHSDILPLHPNYEYIGKSCVRKTTHMPKKKNTNFEIQGMIFPFRYVNFASILCK